MRFILSLRYSILIPVLLCAFRLTAAAVQVSKKNGTEKRRADSFDLQPPNKDAYTADLNQIIGDFLAMERNSFIHNKNH